MSCCGPASYPCASCPYRRDVPSGVWGGEEYDRLPGFDFPDRSFTIFLCHQQNGHLCAGWVGCHDMENMIGLRLAASMGELTPSDVELARNYVSPVPLFSSGLEAAEHGRRALRNPPPEAQRVARKLEARRERASAREAEPPVKVEP